MLKENSSRLSNNQMQGEILYKWPKLDKKKPKETRAESEIVQIDVFSLREINKVRDIKLKFQDSVRPKVRDKVQNKHLPKKLKLK